MKRVVLIDNRLLHGQVAIQWCGYLNVNKVVVVNDKVIDDQIRQNLMKMSMPSYATLEFSSIDSFVCKEAEFVVCETVQDVLRLVKKGIEIHKICVGNMHMSEGKTQIGNYVAVDEKDIETFTELKESNIEIEIRRLPELASEDTFKLFK